MNFTEMMKLIGSAIQPASGDLIEVSKDGYNKQMFTMKSKSLQPC